MQILHQDVKTVRSITSHQHRPWPSLSSDKCWMFIRSILSASKVVDWKWLSRTTWFDEVELSCSNEWSSSLSNGSIACKPANVVLMVTLREKMTSSNSDQQTKTSQLWLHSCIWWSYRWLEPSCCWETAPVSAVVLGNSFIIAWMCWKASKSLRLGSLNDSSKSENYRPHHWQSITHIDSNSIWGGKFKSYLDRWSGNRNWFVAICWRYELFRALQKSN